MTIALSVNTVSSIGVALGMANYASSGSIELQLALRPTFDFCMAPIITGIPRSSPVTIGGLNQRANYYARARTRPSSGVAEPWSNIVGFRTLDGPAQNLSVPQIVMAPAAIVVPEPAISIAGVTSDTGEVNGFPASNLLIDSPVAWRSIAANGIYRIDVNIAGGPIDTIALLRTNAPEDAVIIASAGNTQAQSSGAQTALFTSTTKQFRASANLPGRVGGYHGLLQLPSPQSYPWWSIFIESSGGVAGSLLHAEHFVIGKNRASKTVTIGASEQGGNLGSLDRSRSGVAARADGYRMRHTEFDISYMTEAQYQALYADLAFHVNDPILIIPNSLAGPYLHDRMLYGTLGATKSQLASSLHETRSFAIDSMI